MLRDDFPRDLNDRFEPIRLLGRGGMGAVFLARERGLDRQVAIKLQHLQDNEELMTRFLQEGKLLARVEHPHVLRVYSVGTCEQGPYLVLEYLEGRELQRVDRDVPVVELMLELADGLEAVHAAGILHRDIKPSNVMVTRENRAVLVDFGLAWGQDSDMLTGTGRIVGTLGYMAPELLVGQRATPASDWYAWGVTLFHLLEGRLPYRGKQVEAAMRGEPFPGPRFQRISEGHPLAVAIRSALASDPGRRPRSRAAYEERLGGREGRQGWDRNPSRTLDLSDLASLPTAAPSYAPPEPPSLLSGAQLQQESTVPTSGRAPRFAGAVLAATGFAGLALAALHLAPPGAAPTPTSVPTRDASSELGATREALLGAVEEIEGVLERCATWRSGDRDFPPHDVAVPPPPLLGPLGRVQARLEDWRMAGGDLTEDTAAMSSLRRRLILMVRDLSRQVRGLRALSSIVPDQIATVATDGPLPTRPPVWDYALGGGLLSDWDRTHARTGDIAAVLQVPEAPLELEAYADGLENWFDDHPAGHRILALGTPEDPAARLLADRVRPVVDGLLALAEASPSEAVADRLLGTPINLFGTYLIRACETDASGHEALAWLRQVSSRVRRRARAFSPAQRANNLRILLSRIQASPWRRTTTSASARCLEPDDARWIRDLAQETLEAHQAAGDRARLRLLRIHCSPAPDIPDAVRAALVTACPPEEPTR